MPRALAFLGVCLSLCLSALVSLTVVANSARRELVAEKVPIERIAQVIGYGDSVPSLPNDPTNPLNRRISITVIPPKIKGEIKMGGMSPV